MNDSMLCKHDLVVDTCALCKEDPRSAPPDALPDVTTCNSCEAEIRWVVTAKGKRMPLDADPSFDGRYVFAQRGSDRVSYLGERELENWTGDKYASHFATCVDADGWRRSR